jgi:hypothetical protein
MTISNEDILNAVQALAPRWSELLGDTGATKAQSLVAVAKKDEESARQAADLLLELFDREGARDELREQMTLEELSPGGHRLFTPLPGESEVAASGVVYRCPVKTCSVRWQMQVAGQPIPRCAKHNERLVPV